MMPVKDILALRHLKPRPPILVIDETSIKCADDMGPVCGCDEKYKLIKDYKPFLPGGVNPYNRRKIDECENIDIMWQRLRIGSYGLSFEKPIVVPRSEVPEGQAEPCDDDEDDFMFVRQPKYTEEYLMEKMNQCEREHSEKCDCRNK